MPTTLDQFRQTSSPDRRTTALPTDSLAPARTPTHPQRQPAYQEAPQYQPRQGLPPPPEGGELFRGSADELRVGTLLRQLGRAFWTLLGSALKSTLALVPVLVVLLAVASVTTVDFLSDLATNVVKNSAPDLPKGSAKKPTPAKKCPPPPPCECQCNCNFYDPLGTSSAEPFSPREVAKASQRKQQPEAQEQPPARGDTGLEDTETELPDDQEVARSTPLNPVQWALYRVAPVACTIGVSLSNAWKLWDQFKSPNVETGDPQL